MRKCIWKAKMKLIYILFLLLCVFVKFTKAQQSSVTENKKVYVVGDVVKPSELEFRETMTLTQAIAEAGGVFPDNKRKIVRISRLVPGAKNRERVEVRIKEIEKRKTEDLILQPNDIVDVMPKKKRVGCLNFPIEPTRVLIIIP